MPYFYFIDNVPLGIRVWLRPQVQVWVDRNDYPVKEFFLPNRESVHMCRRPWPHDPDVITTVGSERDWDERIIKDYLQSCSSSKF